MYPVAYMKPAINSQDDVQPSHIQPQSSAPVHNNNTQK